MPALTVAWLGCVRMQVECAEISNGKAKREVEQLTEAMEELTEISGPPIGTLSQQMAKGARL